MNIVGMIAMHSRNARDALAMMEKYQTLVSTSGQISLKSDGPDLELR